MELQITAQGGRTVVRGRKTDSAAFPAAPANNPKEQHAA